MKLELDIETFNSEFIFRHSFNSKEIEVLRNRFKNVIIDNIPEAWVLSIDSFLNENQNLKRIEQHFGFVVVQWKSDPSKKDKKALKVLEEELYGIDEDLHLLLDLEEK